MPDPALRPVPAGIDPRGPRFVAALTCLVLAGAVLTGSVLVLAVQVLVFGSPPQPGSREARIPGSTGGWSARAWGRRRSWRTRDRLASRRGSGWR
jgi:hypothetical protein